MLEKERFERFICKRTTGYIKNDSMWNPFFKWNRTVKKNAMLIFALQSFSPRHQRVSKCKKTLRALRIENCPKIEDFSVLAELENLELLELTGKNTLPNLQFLKQMKNLKTFVFDMNVLDGDLTPCLDLSYVYSRKNRKHYNVKDKDMPRGEYVRGNEDIEMWRRME